MVAFRAIAATLPLYWATLAVASEDGRRTFEEFCAPCHGLDGKARTPAGKKLGAHDLGESKLADAEITEKILNGVREKNGKEKMPAFKDRVPAAALPELVAYVKTFRR